MFIPAAGQGPSAVADLSAQVAALGRRVKELTADVLELRTTLDQALATAQLPPTPYPSSGTEYGEAAE